MLVISEGEYLIYGDDRLNLMALEGGLNNLRKKIKNDN